MVLGIPIFKHFRLDHVKIAAVWGAMVREKLLETNFFQVRKSQGILSV